MASITIPEGVTSIGNYTFTGCSHLQSIDVVEDNANYKSIDGVLFNKNVTTLFVFPAEKSSTYVIPEGVTSIGRSAFSGCSSLASITLPESLTSISDYAFSGCSSLASIVIPEGVTEIGNSAFSGCSSLASIVIPEGVTEIGNSAFSGCSSLVFIALPESLISIGNEAFSGCSSLTSIVIPENLTSISDYAFSGCSSLTAITIPEGVASIGRGTFSGCSSLSAITLPEGVTEIGVTAFWGCSSLTTITLSKSLISIGSYAFKNCSNLISIVIPEGVTSIGNETFWGCHNLQEIHNQAIIPPTCGSDCFVDVDQTTCTLYVPQGLLAEYKLADGWKDFENIVEEGSSAIQETGADIMGQTVITACGDGIVVENLPAGKAVTVYTLSGTVVYEGVASGSRTELTLPAGHLYLVKCGQMVTKVAL